MGQGKNQIAILLSGTLHFGQHVLEFALLVVVEQLHDAAFAGGAHIGELILEGRDARFRLWATSRDDDGTPHFTQVLDTRLS